MLNDALRDLLEEIEALEPDAKTEYTDSYEKAYGAALLDKYRKMGLKV